MSALCQLGDIGAVSLTTAEFSYSGNPASRQASAIGLNTAGSSSE
jgi:hypothetical protein